jgi:hypothetical protein
VDLDPFLVSLYVPVDDWWKADHPSSAPRKPGRPAHPSESEILTPCPSSPNGPASAARTGAPVRAVALTSADEACRGGALPLAEPRVAPGGGRRGCAALIGYAAGKTLVWAEFKETMKHTSLLTVSLALSLTVLGVTQLAVMNDVLAAFVAASQNSVKGKSKSRRTDIRRFTYSKSKRCISRGCSSRL